jgi:hypothetical protein
MAEKATQKPVRRYFSCNIVVETRAKNRFNFSQISYTKQMNDLERTKYEKVRGIGPENTQNSKRIA